MARILEQWMQLTYAEGAAIRVAAWPSVMSIQDRKIALRQSFSLVARQCAEEEAAAGTAGTGEKPFRAEVGRLINLINRNGAALAAQLSAARGRQRLLEDANRNLDRIQRSYVRPSTPAAWHSYS